MSRLCVRTMMLPIAGALVLALAGCDSSSSSATVTVSGTLAYSGGVVGIGGSGSPYHVMPGTVYLKSGGETRSVAADEQGHFSARVPPGIYVVTGKSSHFTVNGVLVACTAVGGKVDASRDRSGVIVLCAGT